MKGGLFHLRNLAGQGFMYMFIISFMISEFFYFKMNIMYYECLCFMIAVFVFILIIQLLFGSLGGGGGGGGAMGGIMGGFHGGHKGGKGGHHY